MCISKFQFDLLNQKILIRVDCKLAKEILQKDVKNNASKQFFARWQAILSIFDFEMEYLEGTSNSLPDYLTLEFLQTKKKLCCLRHPRSSGKGFKLALLEPSPKRVSPSKIGSSTQAGSSTQKSKQQDGSFTQLVEIKSESSTQGPSKIQTSKQTKADYAFPIETLFALQEIGLTKLPKKTWVGIASELDDDSEIYLKTQIQKTKDSKVICNTLKEKQIITQWQHQPQNLLTVIFTKTNFQLFCRWSQIIGTRLPLKPQLKCFLLDSTSNQHQTIKQEPFMSSF